MLKRIGIWSKSDPDKIAEFRAQQREEDTELEKIKSGNENNKNFQNLLDPNTANEEELQSIKGIGPAIAERIIFGRPYKTIDDLLRVKGISPKKLKKFRPYLMINDQ
ncbi:MAG: helix-hairpin-helix domain-containing protein [Elusimicrobia bacterium]|nr:helix-hairpin-helix domain-containing protein [Elusimicrobiota bacterium]